MSQKNEKSKFDVEKAEWLEKNHQIKKIRTDGPKKIVEPWIQDFIKSHAKSSAREIYGWLIGRESIEGDIYVFSAIACQRYNQQTFIGASPDPLEVQELSTSLPQGLGMVGIYHSHPADIFHSSIDDITLQNLSKFYPKMLSAVTNGENVEKELNQSRWFQLNEDRLTTDEIAINFAAIPRERFHTLSCFGFIDVDLMVPIKPNLIQQSLQILMGQFEQSWKSASIDFVKENEKKRKKLQKKEKQNFPLIQSPEQLLSRWSMEILSSKPISHINNEDLTLFLKEDLLYKISLAVKTNIPSPNSSSPNTVDFVKITGKIPLLAVNLFDSQDKSLTIEVILEKIKSEFLDDMIQKVSRGFLMINSAKEIQLHTEQPIFLPYPGIPIKMNLFLENISNLQNLNEKSMEEYLQNRSNLNKDHFPKIEKIIELENNALQSMFRRSLVLTNSGLKNTANLLLESLMEIHRIRGNEDKFSELKNIRNILQSMK